MNPERVKEQFPRPPLTAAMALAEVGSIALRWAIVPPRNGFDRETLTELFGIGRSS